MKLMILGLVIVSIITACSKKDSPDIAAQPQRDQVNAVSQAQEIKWVNNLDEGIKLAKGSSKPVMVDFYADWCHWCKKLDQDVYTDPTVIGLAAKFVSVKVDTDKEQKDAQKYNVTGLPTIIFLDPNGELVHTIVGFRASADFAEAMSEVLKQFAK